MYKKILTLFLLLFLITNTFALTDTNLIGYWKLDETSGTNLVDSKDLDHNLTLNAGTVNQTGKIGKAVSLTNAIAQHANGSISSTLTATTQCGWVYPTGGSELGLVYGVGNGDSTGNVLIKSDNGAGSGTKIGSFAPGVAYGPVSTTDFDESTWNFICFAKTGTSGKIYKNGSLLATTGNPVDATGVTNYFFGGQGSTFGAMTASYDELSHWNQELTLSEIQELYNSGNGTTYCPDEDGIPPIDRFSLTCEYFGINSNFNSTVNASTATIDFNDTSTGTTIVINDWNWIIDDILESTDQNFTLTGITNNTDYNSCLISSGYEDTNILNIATDSICKTINSGRWYADWNFYMYDEDTDTALGGVTLTITTQAGSEVFTLGTETTLTYDNNLSSLLGTSTENINLEFSKTGYGTREYEFLGNKFSDYDLNLAFLMMPENTVSKDIQFRFYLPDRTTNIGNVYLEVLSADDENRVVDRELTSNGYATIFLDSSNSSYLFNFTYNSVDYEYNAITLTINKPKDEETGDTIDGNWNYNVTGVASSSQSDINATSTALALYANTHDTYDLIVSSNNTDYSVRTYNLKERGQTDINLHPYLALSANSSNIKIQLRDNVNKVIRDAQIDFYKEIDDDGRVLITSIVTDYFGDATANLIIESGHNIYEIEVTINGEKQTFSGLDYFKKVITQTPETITINIDAEIIQQALSFWNLTPSIINRDTNGEIRWNSNYTRQSITFVKQYASDHTTFVTQTTSDASTTIENTYIFTMDDYGTWRVIAYVDGQARMRWDMNYTCVEIGGSCLPSWEEIETTTNNEQAIYIGLFILLLILSVLIGYYTPFGMEAFFILVLILPMLVGLVHLQWLIMSLTGIIWIGLRILNNILKTSQG